MIRLFFNLGILFIFIGCKGFTLNYAQVNLSHYISNSDSNLYKGKTFLGYRDGFPIFDVSEMNLLIVYKNSYQVLIRYKSSYEPLFINDNCIVFKEPKSNNVIIQSEESTHIIKLDFAVYSAVVDNECKMLYYTGFDSQIFRLDILSGERKTLNIIGFVETIINDFLYFSIVPDSEIIYPNIDLYRIEIDNSSSKERVVSNISGEALFISPDERFIIDMVLIDGKFQPCFYNIFTKKFSSLPIYENYNEIPYFSIIEKCLVFYSTDDTYLKYVEIPDK